MRNNLCDRVYEYVHPSLVKLAKNKKSLPKETNQKVEARAEEQKV